MTSDINPSPLIIPRSEHSISRKNIDREALKVMHRLRDNGFKAYLVGGGVRDLLIGKTPKDFDISTDARPGQLRKLFRNSRIIGRRFRLVQVFFHGEKIVEVSTLRRRSEFDLDGNAEVLAANNTYGTPEEDAFRRDLTINGLFYEIESFTIIDYIGGVKDIEDRIVRIIGDPEKRITRDPVRMLRAIRHAARSGFAIEPTTWEAIRKNTAMLSVCPVSRIRDELLKDLLGGAACEWAKLAVDSGVFAVLFPFYPQTGDDGQQTIPAACVEMLLPLLKVVDRLGASGQKLPETMLIGLIVLPWVQYEMQLLGKVRQGKEGYAFARQLRERLDEILEHLNIKRATKEMVTTILVNLPLFQKYPQQDWPKWLSRKSYFTDCLQFYQIVDEARGGQTVTAIEPTAAKAVKIRSRPQHRSNRQPAYSKKNKGGIFGFRK